MLKHGYPWPRIVDCAQYPIDNDMCIKAQLQQPPSSGSHHRTASSLSSSSSSSLNFSNKRVHSRPSVSGASSSTSGHSYEAILNRFCMSNWTMRARATLQWNANDAQLHIHTFRMLFGSLPNKTIVSTNATTGEHLARFMPLRVPISLIDSATIRKGSPSPIRKFLLLGQTLSDQRLKVILVTPYNTKSKDFRFESDPMNRPKSIDYFRTNFCFLTNQHTETLFATYEKTM